MSRKIVLTVIVVLAGYLCAGCVERLITITSKPAGAIVWLNDEEVGATPVTVPFTWYGQYSVVLRQEGYQPIITARKVDAPIYQWPGIDLFAECLLPVNLVDKHQWDFIMQPMAPVNVEELTGRAEEFRREATMAQRKQ